jgi:hypothetical protein
MLFPANTLLAIFQQDALIANEEALASALQRMSGRQDWLVKVHPDVLSSFAAQRDESSRQRRTLDTLERCMLTALLLGACLCSQIALQI